MKKERTEISDCRLTVVEKMYNYDNFEGAYECACDSVMSRESEQLVLEGIGELIEEKEERIDEMMREIETMSKELGILRERFEEIVAERQ